MAYQDFMREQQERVEDVFIDQAEAGINKDQSFDQCFPEGWGVNYRLSPTWRDRYEKMASDAKPYRQYHKAWSADGERKKIMDLRKAQREQEDDERFYKSNEFWLKEHIKAGHNFEKTGYPEHMRPLFERAQREQLGRIPEEKPAPEYDPFLAGFSAD